LTIWISDMPCSSKYRIRSDLPQRAVHSPPEMADA